MVWGVVVCASLRARLRLGWARQVIRGGENISCAEVEAAVYEHPDVAEAAVFGIPDDRLGELVRGGLPWPRCG
jgi:hypothetical protein